MYIKQINHKYVLLTGAMVALTVLALLLSTRNTSAQSTSFTSTDYATAVDYSNMFFEAQRAGDTDDSDYMSRRIDWRVPSVVDDGDDVDLDLSGGWFDAGDHVKFHLPMAYSAAVLGMGVVQFEDAYKHSGAHDRALDNLRWVNDYFVKANPSSGVFYVQVGEGQADHNFWGPPEKIGTPEKSNNGLPRTSFVLPSGCGGDILGATAASLAQASIAFRNNGESTYANQLLRAARTYYAAGESRLKVYTADGCVQDTTSWGRYFYESASYTDDLMMGAISLHIAETNSGNKRQYLDDAKAYYNQIKGDGDLYGWMMDWDNNEFPAMLLLAQATDDSTIENDFKNMIDPVINVTGECDTSTSQTYCLTPDGLFYLTDWGPARYPANASFLALSYAKHLEDNGSDDTAAINNYRNWSRGQIDYLLGDNDNDFSYMVGFGSDYAEFPHHRGAHLSSADGTYPPSNTWRDDDSNKNKNVLYGALVGGPDNSGNHTDQRHGDVGIRQNEVATDYNAGFQGALAGVYDYVTDLSTTPETPETPETPDGDTLDIYTDSLADGWSKDWSWNEEDVNVNDSSEAASGSRSIMAHINRYGGFSLGWGSSNINNSDYAYLEFKVKVASGSRDLTATPDDASSNQEAFRATSQWKTVRVSLDGLSGKFNRFDIKSADGQEVKFWVDDIRLVQATEPEPPTPTGETRDIYTDSLADGWSENWSWNEEDVNVRDGSEAASGSRSIMAHINQYGGFSLGWGSSDIDNSDYAYLEFEVKVASGTRGMTATPDNATGNQEAFQATSQWKTVRVSLDGLSGKFNRFDIKSADGQEVKFWVDEIRLVE